MIHATAGKAPNVKPLLEEPPNISCASNTYLSRSNTSQLGYLSSTESATHPHLLAKYARVG